MKRLLFVFPLVLLAGAANATGIKIHNNSGLPIDELFVSAPGKKAWGANLLEGVPEGALDSGKSVQVAGLKAGTYDFRVSAPDEGVLCYMKNVKVKGSSLDLTAAMGKACK